MRSGNAGQFVEGLFHGVIAASEHLHNRRPALLHHGQAGCAVWSWSNEKSYSCRNATRQGAAKPLPARYAREGGKPPRRPARAASAAKHSDIRLLSSSCQYGDK